jgi:hypothetical protein
MNPVRLARRLSKLGAAAVAALSIVLVARGARADGGSVQLQQVDGAFRVTVFTAPTPLRAGPADISVLVQDVANDEPVLDAEVVLALTSTGADAALHAAATRQQASNKLLYAALVNLPSAGAWDLRVTVRRGRAAAVVGGRMAVAPALPPLLAHWPYLAFPPIAVLVFAVHQWRRLRSSKAS